MYTGVSFTLEPDCQKSGDMPPVWKVRGSGSAASAVVWIRYFWSSSFKLILFPSLIIQLKKTSIWIYNHESKWRCGRHQKMQSVWLISLLHRPPFIKYSLLTTEQIISPATSTREKRVSRASRFSDWGGSRSEWSDELTCYFDF